MKKFKVIFFLSFLLILTSCSSIQKTEVLSSSQYYPDMVVGKVISVYDGDTFRVDLVSSKGMPDIIGKNIPIRIVGIDTPEIRGSSQRLTKIANDAKNHTEEMLRNSDVIILTDIQRGKYFRIVARVLIDGKDLGQDLIDRGLAKEYVGGNKKALWDRRFK